MTAAPDPSPGKPLSPAAADCLAGGGEMGAMMRALDWARTPVGAVEGWPQSLRTAVSIVLTSRHPMFIWWGPELVQFYNDAYRPILGSKKHPAALGQRGRDCWPEIWTVIEPLIESVMQRGEATWKDDSLLVLDRYGYLEECYFDYAYSPVRDESGGVGGVFVVCSERTQSVLGNRRLKTLRDLGERDPAQAQTAAEVCRAAAATLAANPYDFPFALIYLLDDDGRRACLAEAVHLAAGTPASPVETGGEEDAWGFGRVRESGECQVVDDLEERFGRLPAGVWTEETTRRALVLPLKKAGEQEHPAGYLVAGLSPRLALDADYRGFLELAAGQIATAVASARAYEEERRRAEALAELDRAKTAFFGNVSHEFRTPLTLMLGPLEDVLAQPDGLADEHRERLRMAHRNSLRLLKLVNTLLDFSRIEAGRLQASYEPVDLAAFTADLASVFRSAAERAGLRLVVDCPPLAEPIHVDREMWEKVVLNLVSNAYKFTFAGEIEVRLRREGGEAVLTVRDTGEGIPRKELPHLFERFHRVQGARGRTLEGSGIGLALVRELVVLHGGTVSAESEVGRGTVFTVRIPAGTAHLPADRIAAPRHLPSTGLGGEVYVEEALRWVLEDGGLEEAPRRADAGAGGAAGRARILLADDNADLREYVRRLLARDYEVEAVADGTAALRAARERPPDLVLTDVMMPGLDGFALLAELRADERLKTVPVLLLSARAGEEARVEGMDAGADDYLVKPFSAKELLARVQAHVGMARVRREAQAALRASEELLQMSLSGARAGAWQWNLVTQEVTWSPEIYELFGLPPEKGPSLEAFFGVFEPEQREAMMAQFTAAAERGGSFELEFRFQRSDRSEIWLSSVGRVTLDAAGKPVLASGINQDITARKRAELHARFLLDLDAALAALDDPEEIEQTAVDRLGAYLGVDHLYFVQVEGHRAVVMREYRRDVSGITGGVGSGGNGGVGGSGSAGSIVGEYDMESYFSPEALEQLHGGESSVVADVAADPRTAAAADRFAALGVRAVITTPVKHQHRWVGALSCVSRVPRAWRADEVHLMHDLAARVWPLLEQARVAQALREADRRKDEFLAMLAHELRNPLAPIRNAAQVLKLVGPADSHQQWAREVIERQTRHLMRLVDDLLDVSRITQGKVTLSREPVDLATIVHNAVEASRPLIDARRHQLTVGLPDEPVRVEGDLTRLVQIVGNLLNNAAKYTDEGGHLRIEAAREDGEAVIRVRDDGMGLPQDLLPHVFDLFTQADRSLDRSQGGLGIGLTLVRRLVELHGGRVEARSGGSGQGSEFIVRLPALAAGGEAAGAAVAGPAGSAARGLKILLVEDNVDSAEMMRYVLELGGHEVRTAYDGREALEAVRTFQPQAVVCDIGLPGMNGYEVAARLREQPAFRQTPLIALTGYGQEEARRRAEAAGFDYHFVKPVEPEALGGLLESLKSKSL